MTNIACIPALFCAAHMQSYGVNSVSHTLSRKVCDFAQGEQTICQENFIILLAIADKK